LKPPIAERLPRDPEDLAERLMSLEPLPRRLHQRPDETAARNPPTIAATAVPSRVIASARLSIRW
jgi:hypothetical protein